MLRQLLKTTLWSTTKVFLTYDNIQLKTFLEIASTGNVQLLCIRGKAGQVELVKRWEELVRINSDHNDDSNYDVYLDNLKTYGEFMNQYTMVKAMLTVLCYQIDDEYIEELKQLGYNIAVSKDPDQSGKKAYLESLEAAMRKSDNLVTKLKSKYNELLDLTKEVGEERVTLGSLIAQVSFALGFNIPDTITLSQFNEYKRIVKQKYNEQRNKQAGHNF